MPEGSAPIDASYALSVWIDTRFWHHKSERGGDRELSAWLLHALAPHYNRCAPYLIKSGAIPADRRMLSVPTTRKAVVSLNEGFSFLRLRRSSQLTKGLITQFAHMRDQLRGQSTSIRGWVDTPLALVRIQHCAPLEDQKFQQSTDAELTDLKSLLYGRLNR